MSARAATVSPNGPAVDDTLKGATSTWNATGGTPRPGGHRILAPTAAIWHHDRIGQPVKRSPIAYDSC